MDLINNKKYIVYNLSEDTDLFRGYFGDGYSIEKDMLVKISKALGFPYELYDTLSSISPEAGDTIVSSMSKHQSQDSIVLLVDEELKTVIGFSLEYQRLPILNSDFMHRSLSQLEATDFVSISECYYDKDSTISSMIINRKDPIVIEEKYEGKPSEFVEYNVGVLLVNDELDNTYTRLVLYVNDHPLYLPATYYNATTNRFKRSTSNNPEALEVLLLKIIEDLRGEDFASRLYDFHYRYRSTKFISSSYEEYNNIVRVMRKIPTVIEDNSLLDDLLSLYDNFEEKYYNLEDQKSSYVWRCTAIGDIPIGYLVNTAINILSTLYAPAPEYFDIRDLLGYYISTPRIVEEIAKESLK